MGLVCSYRTISAQNAFEIAVVDIEEEHTAWRHSEIVRGEGVRG